MPIAIPARMPATTSGPITGAAERTRLPTVWSRRPSRMSRAASTTIPWNQYVAIVPIAATISAPRMPTSPA